MTELATVIRLHRRYHGRPVWCRRDEARIRRMTAYLVAQTRPYPDPAPERIPDDAQADHG
jgi:hypothetical protein